jgi:hypothetical protein
VFGDRFRYSNCKQLTARPHLRSSAMQQLARGSVILFGSQVDGDFVLDTVLVVASATRYTANDVEHLGADEAFATCTLQSVATTMPAGFECSRFTLFTGATVDEPVNGMFSFTPCYPDGDEARFARPPIRLPGLVNPASKQSTFGSHRRLSPESVHAAWEQVRRQVLAHDLWLGTHFDTPPREGAERADSAARDAPLVSRGIECASRAEFTELLRRWFDRTSEPTIGDPGKFGGKAWVWVRLDGQRCHLNADSTRAGIGRYLQLARELGPKLPWRVVANNRGRVNKVVIEPSGEPTPGLFLYTTNALPAPTTL